ncbi:93_t:CDS:2, partial [Dentiscutata erythropus]
KIARRALAFKYLYGKKDSQVTKYNTDELTNLLIDNDIYSPELLDSGKATDKKGQLYINVYGLSWRRSHTLKVQRPEGVPDWAAGEENEEIYS